MWDVFGVSILTRTLSSFLGNWSDTIFNTSTFQKRSKVLEHDYKTLSYTSLVRNKTKFNS